MDQNRGKVYIVLVNWNGWRDTIECLESIYQSDYSNFQVIVCDNASDDGSIEHIMGWARNNIAFQYWQAWSKGFEQVVVHERTVGKPIHESSLVLINTGDNLGFAGGNNIGIRFALYRSDFDYVWLLNNDTTIEAYTLSEIIKRMGENPKPEVCGTTILYYNQPDKVQALGGAVYNIWTGMAKNIGALKSWPLDVDLRAVEAKVTYVLGASMVITKKFIESTGLMSDEYFLYFEELDWLTRAHRSSKMAYASNAIVYHKEGASIGSSYKRNIRSRLSYYWLFRSRLRYTIKFYPFALPSVTFFAIVQLMKIGLSTQNLSLVAAGLKGIRDAFILT